MCINQSVRGSCEGIIELALSKFYTLLVLGEKFENYAKISQIINSGLEKI